MSKGGIILPPRMQKPDSEAIEAPENECEDCKDLFNDYPSDQLLSKLRTETIRKHYPRVFCRACNTLRYASYMHYLAGDY